MLQKTRGNIRVALAALVLLLLLLPVLLLPSMRQLLLLLLSMWLLPLLLLLSTASPVPKTSSGPFCKLCRCWSAGLAGLVTLRTLTAALGYRVQGSWQQQGQQLLLLVQLQQW
jgi:hypothetical protein